MLTARFKGGQSLVLSYVFPLFVLLLLAPLAFSQTSSTGALTGTVKDSSGAVVPNATVTATSIGTGQARTTTTDADGTYKFGLLPPGDYKLKFEASGFNTVEVPSVTIVVTETAVLDQTLQVGAQTQQVEVRGEDRSGADRQFHRGHGGKLANHDGYAFDLAQLHQPVGPRGRGQCWRVQCGQHGQGLAGHRREWLRHCSEQLSAWMGPPS